MVNDEFSDGPGPKVGDGEEKTCPDGVYDPWNREKPSSFKRVMSRSETPFLLIGVSLIVLIIVFFMFVPRSGEDEVGRKLAFLEKRLAPLEDKLVRLEENLSRVPVAGDAAGRIEKQAAACERALDRFESVEASLTSRIERIAQDVDKLKKDALTIDRKPAAPPRADSPAPAKIDKKSVPEAKGAGVAAVQGNKPSYHQVRAGETLFGIGRQYNVTVDVLRRLNKLTEKDVITPGQKLIVAGAGEEKR